MPTKAQMEQTIADLQHTIGVHSTDKQAKDTEIKRLSAENGRLEDRIATLEANRIHHIAMLEQMRGFIRAHHTEKIPTGAFTSEYNPTTGQYDNVPIITERYPFMDIVTETFER